QSSGSPPAQIIRTPAGGRRITDSARGAREAFASPRAAGLFENLNFANASTDVDRSALRFCCGNRVAPRFVAQFQYWRTVAKTLLAKTKPNLCDRRITPLVGR